MSLLFIPNSPSHWVYSNVKVQDLLKPDYSTGMPQGLRFRSIPCQVTIEWGQCMGVLLFSRLLVDECICALCTFHLYDGLLRKFNPKPTESSSFAHTDTWWWKLLSLNNAARKTSNQQFSIVSHWHLSELLSAFANSGWQVSKAIWVHAKAVTQRGFKFV